MKKCIIFILLALFLIPSVALGQKKYYVPENIEVTIADGAAIPEEVLPAVKENIKIYTADLSSWEKSSKPVNVLVKIIKIEEAHIASSFVFGAFSPSILTGEITIFDGDKKRIIPVTAKSRSTVFTAFFGKTGMNQRLAVYFADAVIATIQQPFTD